MAKAVVLITAALLFLGAILPPSSAKEEVDFAASDKEIGYGALERGNVYGHPVKNPQNPYHRACESSEHCRSGRRLLDMGDAVDGAEEGAEDVKDKVVNLFQ